MPDLKKDWPDLLYKIIIAIVSILLGSQQYVEHKEHQEFKQLVSEIVDTEWYAADQHTDYLGDETNDL